MKPLIGITVNYIKDGDVGTAAHIGLPGQSWQALADDYVRAVLQAGGMPVLVPVLPEQDSVKEYLEHLDGILFSGGCDVSPLCYGQDVTSKVGELCPERDEQELALIRTALEMPQFPVLCICRGCQLLNVALGGTLVPDMDTKTCGDHFPSQQQMSVLTHRIKRPPGSLIDRLLGQESRVNSFHHQCVAQPGAGVSVTASDCHGVPECIEVPDRDGFTLGTQWHPEGLALVNEHHLNLFRAFIEAADQYRNSRN